MNHRILKKYSSIQKIHNSLEEIRWLKTFPKTFSQRSQNTKSDPWCAWAVGAETIIHYGKMFPHPCLMTALGWELERDREGAMVCYSLQIPRGTFSSGFYLCGKRSSEGSVSIRTNQNIWEHHSRVLFPCAKRTYDPVRSKHGEYFGKWYRNSAKIH